jgi:Rrf2 family protein
MILTKTTEYAVRVLIFMANQNRELFTVKYLHEQLNIPYKYLTQLMTRLAKSDQGLLTSIQGRDGGFKINKKLSVVSLAKIIEAVEGMDSFNTCFLGFEECSDENPCAMHFVWEKHKELFLNTLNTTTLDDLKEMEAVKF